MSLTYNTNTFTVSNNNTTSAISNFTPNTITIPNTTIPSDSITIGTIQSYTTSATEFKFTPEYYLYPQIVDINVYGHDKPKVVEVEFKYEYGTTKIKSICCDEDEFDLKKGVYIAMSKLLYGDTYTTEGVEEKAHELSLKKDNEKMVNKAIKDYYKKLKNEKEEKKKEEEEKIAKLKRKAKNEEKRKRRKEKSQNELKRLIREATMD